jgi:type VI secretion system protein ImpG
MVRHGALMRGTEFKLSMNDASYGSIADSYLFGMVLHRFFSSYANINTFTRTRVHTHPSNLEFQWQPMFGEASRS